VCNCSVQGEEDGGEGAGSESEFVERGLSEQSKRMTMELSYYSTQDIPNREQNVTVSLHSTHSSSSTQ
jgi:hypothetical protein